MKILYARQPDSNQQHKIFYAIYDSDWFKFSHTTNIPLEVMEIDEVGPDNRGICLNLKETMNRTDIENENKYHIKIENNQPVLYEKEGWEAYHEEI